jgi:hypothetical protein
MAKRKSKRVLMSPIEKYIGAKLGGLNQSTKAQLKKIENITVNTEIPQVPLCNFYVRSKNIWQHKGISCRLCGVLLSDQKILDKHRYICKVLKDKQKDINNQ